MASWVEEESVAVLHAVTGLLTMKNKDRVEHTCKHGTRFGMFCAQAMRTPRRAPGVVRVHTDQRYFSWLARLRVRVGYMTSRMYEASTLGAKS